MYALGGCCFVLGAGSLYVALAVINLICTPGWPGTETLLLLPSTELKVCTAITNSGYAYV